MTPNPFQQIILLSLNAFALKGKRHIYAGTVTAKEKARRRARNKRARVARRVNR